MASVMKREGVYVNTIGTVHTAKHANKTFMVKIAHLVQTVVSMGCVIKQMVLVFVTQIGKVRDVMNVLSGITPRIAHPVQIVGNHNLGVSVWTELVFVNSHGQVNSATLVWKTIMVEIVSLVIPVNTDCVKIPCVSASWAGLVQGVKCAKMTRRV